MRGAGDLCVDRLSPNCGVGSVFGEVWVLGSGSRFDSIENYAEAGDYSSLQVANWKNNKQNAVHKIWVIKLPASSFFCF